MNDYIIENQCPYCGEVHWVEVCEEDFLNWQNGMPIYEALPYLSPAEHDAIIFGICPVCWEAEEEAGEEDEEEF